MKYIAFLLAIFAIPHATAAKNTAKDVAKVLASYREAKAIKAKVQKTVEQETMGTSTESQGQFFFSKGKMRLDIVEPEKTTLVYDGKHIWFESRADEEHIVVTKMPANQLKKSDSLLAALFDKKNVLENFTLKKTSVDDGKKTYIFDAKDKAKSDVQTLEITLKEKEILRISYKDQIENKVTLNFSDTTRGAVSAKKFAYKPPKGAELSEP